MFLIVTCLGERNPGSIPGKYGSFDFWYGLGTMQLQDDCGHAMEDTVKQYTATMNEQVNGQRLAVRLTVVIAALVMIAALGFGISTLPADAAWAVSSGSESAQSGDSATGKAVSGEKNADDGTKASSDTANKTEEIKDDKTPMSSGLGGGEPVSGSGVSFGAIAIAGIALVALFYFMLTRRLNNNISDMRKRLK